MKFDDEELELILKALYFYDEQDFTLSEHEQDKKLCRRLQAKIRVYINGEPFLS